MKQCFAVAVVAALFTMAVSLRAADQVEARSKT
jgi:hypothetical protein